MCKLNLIICYIFYVFYANFNFYITSYYEPIMVQTKTENVFETSQ